MTRRTTLYRKQSNCPRPVDKYLGEAGSRRIKERFECDELEHVDSDVLEWGDEMFRVMVASTKDGDSADKPEVCDWPQPESLLLSKIIDENGYEVGQGPPGFRLLQMALLGALSLAVGAQILTSEVTGEL
eukprot:jgi/Psemu1/292718/fgenesh1_pg.1247_\